MGMTITEKILSHASNCNKVAPGEIVFANVDKVMIHDVSGPGVIKVFKELEKKGYRLKKFGILAKYGFRKIILSLPPTEYRLIM